MIGSMGGADKSLKFATLCLALAAVLSACSSFPPRAQGAQGALRAPAPRAAFASAPAPAPARPPPPLSPFADSSISFFVHGNFARGEQVVVRVCLHADHSIASSDILESSGDRRFDEMALDWARRVQLRSAPVPGRAVARCGPVRVELHDSAQPGMGHQVGEQLG